MGILERLGLGRGTSNLLESAYQLGINSPYSAPVELPPFVVTDLLDDDVVKRLPMDRTSAISIPAVSKARNLLVSTISKFPLRALSGDTVLDSKAQPTFLYRSDSAVTPYERMAWTVDDLIFHGCSLWLVRRGGTPDTSGRRPILDAEWCPQNLWTITDGHLLVDGVDVPNDSVILFNSPFEGLLNVGTRTLRGAIDQEVAWVGRAKNPVPMIDLHRTSDALEEEEVEAFVTAWAKARTAENGAIGSTPEGIEIRTYGEIRADLMVEGRNAIRTDIGSFLNVRASMLDGTAGVDSLTYSTKEGDRNLFYEMDLPFWTDPIEARLSMDDVVPRGQRVRFDKYEAFNLPSSTGPTVED